METVNTHSVGRLGSRCLRWERMLKVRLASLAVLSILAAGGHSSAQNIVSPNEGAPAPRMLASPRDASEYYPPASLRLGEKGRVVLRFTVGADGKAVKPLSVDDGQSSNPTVRLIVAAEQYLRDSTFETDAHYKKLLTVSFVFELAPCGLLEHSLVHDYAINLCRERQIEALQIFD
jgi:outer membrane biosynthesis protein TonB